MASSDATQRAVLAGLSCGIGLAAPVVMYAATLPFSSVNETVVAGAVPFAVGAVAGVGIYAASLGISEYRAEHDGRLFEPDAVGGAAQFGRTHNEFKTASIPAQQQGPAPQPAVPADQANAAQPSSAFLSGLTGAFQHRSLRGACGQRRHNAAYNGASSAAYTSAAAAASAGQQSAAQPGPVADPFADEPLAVDEETIAARRAAESSLWGASAQMQAAEAAPYNAKLASMPIISDAKGVDLADLDEPSAITASIDVQDRVDTDSLPDASLEEDIPMADYSGHEDMWAAAMAIMAEVAEPAPVAVPTTAASPASVAPVYVGRHSSVLPEDTARISREGIERAEAIAAGVMENRRHERVNQILEEEINRLESAAVKRTGRAYLSVIEGGTASFTPLRAEA